MAECSLFCRKSKWGQGIAFRHDFGAVAEWSSTYQLPGMAEDDDEARRVYPDLVSEYTSRMSCRPSRNTV
jgi:hypothetical protein